LKHSSTLISKTTEEIKAAGNGFEALSTINFLHGCVGGLLIRIKVPATAEVGMVKSFYTYQMLMNIQAVCDHRCHCIEVSVAAPGGANNIAVFRKSYIAELFNNLPGNYL
jgi:hypothetical protein